jgi:hypothetical protein
MSTDYDASEFIDADFQPQKPPAAGAPAAAGQLLRAPTREEVDTRVAEAHQKLAELKRAQEQLERERNALEEIRRRQHEYHSGRQEMVQNLTRGVGLLEKAEFEARRDSEQMAKTLVEFREALGKIQAIQDQTWTQENLNAELSRALTTLENSRMEWNAARLKFAVLSGPPQAGTAGLESAAGPATVLAGCTFGQLCRIGLALTLPLAVAALLALAALIFVLARH